MYLHSRWILFKNSLKLERVFVDFIKIGKICQKIILDYINNLKYPKKLIRKRKKSDLFRFLLIKLYTKIKKFEKKTNKNCSKNH
jgi:hypothetical protein